MAKKQNPYQLWLGLHPKLTNPNLFQLLGVDPRSQDDAAIKKKAVASAKTLLQRLKAVEVKSDAEKVFKKKLHAKIVLAHETLVSPEKRKQYFQTLVAKTAAENKAATTGAAPTQSEAPAAKASAPISPAVPPSNPNVGNPNVGNPNVDNIPAEIPSAIPMAMPVTPTPPSTPSPTPPLISPLISPSTPPAVEGEPTFSMVDASVGKSEPNFDRLDAEPQIKVYAKKRKTSRSWLVPIVVLVLLVGGVGGLISMMTKYSNIFELIPGLNGAVNEVAVNDPKNPGDPKPEMADPGTKTNPDDPTETASLTVPDTPRHAIQYKGDEDPDMEIPEGGMPLLIDDKSSSSIASPDAQMKEQPKTIIDAAESEGNPFDIKDDAPQNGDMEDPSGELRTVEDSKLNVLRLGLHRSRDALFRQHFDTAKHFNNDVRKLLKIYEITDAKTIAPEQRGLVRAVKTNDQVIGWVIDFWDQVQSSSIEMAGGQEVVVGNKTMGLVEGRDSDVVLRIAGQNEIIPYLDLTPILATTLGEMGSKKSVPRWNLAKAAYLGVMAQQYSDVKDLQYRILNQLKIDGFDVEAQAISDYSNPDWLTLGLPKEKIAPMSDDQVEELIAKDRKRLDYENPSAVPIDRVDALIYKLTLNPRRNTADRVARLWEAVAMIQNGHRTFELMYVNRELDNLCTEVDFGRSFVDPILHIAKKEPDPGFQDQVARQIVIFVKQFDGNPSLTPALREKLIQKVRNVAKDLKSSQLAAMADQLAGMAE